MVSTMTATDNSTKPLKASMNCVLQAKAHAALQVLFDAVKTYSVRSVLHRRENPLLNPAMGSMTTVTTRLMKASMTYLRHARMA